MKKSYIETALVAVSEPDTILVKTQMRFGCVFVTKYAWMKNANHRSDCKFIKESSQEEWDDLLTKGYDLAEVKQDHDVLDEASEYVGTYCLWEGNSKDSLIMSIADKSMEELVKLGNERLRSDKFNAEFVCILPTGQNPVDNADEIEW